MKGSHVLRRAFAITLAVALSIVPIAQPSNSMAKSKKKAVKRITISNPKTKTLALKKGEKFQLKASITPKAAKNNIKFSSSKKNVVKVTKKGKLTAKKVGKATITIASTTKPKKKATVKVTVYKSLKKVKSITLAKTSCTLSVGNTLSLNGKCNPAKATVRKISYVSSQKSVASVSAKGVVKAIKAGTATITAYAMDGRGAKATCKVKVQKASPNAPKVNTLLQQSDADTIVIANSTQAAPIYVDSKGKDAAGLSLVAESFASDVSLVDAKKIKPSVVKDDTKLSEVAILVGSIGNNKIIDSLIAKKTIDVSDIKGKNETYKIMRVDNPSSKVKKAIVVVGSDKRGAIYGLYHISEMMGVSPWVYWGDATPKTQASISFESKELAVTSKEPSVKYRGIFLNDEAPSLTSWVKKKFGNYNEKFYKNVYELILRCKGNYLWPAMWSNVFSNDGKSKSIANAELADQYGIVMGTSHHEPLCRAGEEWQRVYKQYGTSNKWDYDANTSAITNFWRDGVKRNKDYENVITLGMRGEADSALSGTKEENIALLKRIIKTQKKILEENNLSNAPKVFTVYKEVEDFWHGTAEADGLKNYDLLDDVTIMLCDDNFGNMRTLPTVDTKDRKGGWGMYYHFDYHGGPTSYEWVNTVQLNKVWEQMSLAYDRGVDDIWIVNVGDLKPMEMNISYFLDMAYDFDTWGKNGLNKTDDYMTQWVDQQFGDALSPEEIQGVRDVMKEYTWLNTCCKPESLSSATYNATNYNEANEMLGRIEKLIENANKYEKIIPDNLKAAYFELVYFPAVGSANVAKMEIYSGLNKYYAGIQSTSANLYGALIERAIQYDKELNTTYNKNMPQVGNKWEGMMSSPHVGFVTWNSDGWKYPVPKWVTSTTESKMIVNVQNQKDAFTEGECTLNDFTNVNNESYTVVVSNGGGNAFDYTVTKSADWINVSKTSGNVKIQNSFEVSVDFSKVTKDETGTVVIQSGAQKVTLNVNAKKMDVSSLSEKTYVYANGYASILPGNYVSSGKGKNGAEFKLITNYGKSGEIIRTFGENSARTEEAADAPYVDYKVSVPTAGDYKLMVYTAPSNNLERESNSIFFGIKTNDGEIKKENMLTSTFLAGEYSGSWADDVKKSGRTKELTVSLVAGTNTIRVYALEPTFLLQKLVVSEKSVATSHIGPGESYYVGKSLKEKTAYLGAEDEFISLPGTVGISQTATKGQSFSYDCIISKDETYRFNVKASSANGATVKLLWNGEEVGTTTIAADEKNYSFNTEKVLESGEGVFTLSVESGEVKLTNLSVVIKTRVDVPGAFDAVAYEGSGATSGTISLKAKDDYNYTAMVAEENTYQFSVRGKSAQGATVKLMWNDQEIGSVVLGAEEKKYTIDKAIDLPAGEGTIHLCGVSGDATVTAVSSETYDGSPKKGVAMSSSTGDAYVAYDGDAKTAWTPDESDTEKSITFDFKEEYSVDRFAMTETGVTSYEVQVNDGDGFKTVFAGDSLTSDATVYMQGTEVIKGSKLRFVLKGTKISVSEIQVNPYTNWAMKDAVTFTGKSNADKEINIPASVVDGDRITMGMQETPGTSSDKDRHVIEMNFTEPRLIDTIRLFSLQEAEKATPGTGIVPNLDIVSNLAQYSYKFSYYDGAKWNEIGATIRPDEGSFPKVFTEFVMKKKALASAIKIEINTSYFIRINEFEVVQTQKFVPDQLLEQ